MAEGPSRAPRWFTAVIDGAPGLLFLSILLLTRNFRLASAFLVGAALVALAAMLIVERRFRPMPTMVAILAVVFGGASLILHDPQVLKMKTSIVDTILGVVLIGGVAVKRNPLKFVLGSTLNLPDKAWATLAIRYGLYWLACAAANEIVRRTQSDQTWAMFRLASYAVGILFALAQTPLMLKHAASDKPTNTPPPGPGA